MFWQKPKLQLSLLVKGQVCGQSGKSANFLPHRPRFLNQLWAFIAGYFWLPCPLCGRYFGGHEWTGEYSIPNKNRPGISTGVCTSQACIEKAQRITNDFYKSGGWKGGLK